MSSYDERQRQNDTHTQNRRDYRKVKEKAAFIFFPCTFNALVNDERRRERMESEGEKWYDQQVIFNISWTNEGVYVFCSIVVSITSISHSIQLYITYDIWQVMRAQCSMLHAHVCVFWKIFIGKTCSNCQHFRTENSKFKQQKQHQHQQQHDDIRSDYFQICSCLSVIWSLRRTHTFAATQQRTAVNNLMPVNFVVGRSVQMKVATLTAAIAFAFCCCCCCYCLECINKWMHMGFDVYWKLLSLSFSFDTFRMCKQLSTATLSWINNVWDESTNANGTNHQYGNLSALKVNSTEDQCWRRCFVVGFSAFSVLLMLHFMGFTVRNLIRQIVLFQVEEFSVLICAHADFLLWKLFLFTSRIQAHCSQHIFEKPKKKLVPLFSSSQTPSCG